MLYEQECGSRAGYSYHTLAWPSIPIENRIHSHASQGVAKHKPAPESRVFKLPRSNAFPGILIGLPKREQLIAKRIVGPRTRRFRPPSHRNAHPCLGGVWLFQCRGRAPTRTNGVRTNRSSGSICATAGPHTVSYTHLTLPTIYSV